MSRQHRQTLADLHVAAEEVASLDAAARAGYIPKTGPVWNDALRRLTCACNAEVRAHCQTGPVPRWLWSRRLRRAQKKLRRA